MISFFVPEKFKFSYHANLATDDVIGCASTVARHKIKNISAKNEAMLLELGSDARSRSLFSFKSNITICSCMGQCKMYEKCSRGGLMEGGTGVRL